MAEAITMLKWCATANPGHDTYTHRVCVCRNKIRQKYDIPGTFVGDFCCIWFCTCCAIAQQSRELRQRGVVHKYACCY
jgi:Cys-rich protein (TIGR01571 family)